MYLVEFYSACHFLVLVMSVHFVTTYTIHSKTFLSGSIVMVKVDNGYSLEKFHSSMHACRLTLSTDKAVCYRAASNNSQENICG